MKRNNSLKHKDSLPLKILTFIVFIMIIGPLVTRLMIGMLIITLLCIIDLDGMKDADRKNKMKEFYNEKKNK